MLSRPPDRPGGRCVFVLRWAAAGVTLALLASACGDDGSASDSSVTVFAAASLGDVFSDLAVAYEDETAEPVELNIAGSSALRLQLDEGARADVFAPADLAQIELLDVPVSGPPAVVATNQLVVAHPTDGPPIGIDRFDEDALLLGACAPQVPCGGYAATAFELAGIDPALDTEEADVRALAAKVAEGELDAGLVYATDVTADVRLAAVTLDEPVEVRYPVVRLAEAGNAAGGDRFISFLTGPVAQAVFADHGFGAP